MAYITSEIDCCGISELSCIMVDGGDGDYCCEECNGPRDEWEAENQIDKSDRTYKLNAFRALDDALGFNGAFLFFSDNNDNDDEWHSGEILAGLIKKYKLGTLTEQTSVNGNSGNTLKAWFWSVDRGALKSAPWKKDFEALKEQDTKKGKK